MKNKKIILAGGSGFIGQEMIRYFGKENELIVLSRLEAGAANNRNHYASLTADEMKYVKLVKWDGRTPGDWVQEIDRAHLLINLAGRSVNCRYTQKNKAAILHSRLESVAVLGQAIQQCAHPPELWINASSATIYRHATDRPQDEEYGEYGDGFSVMVCQEWEKAFYAQNTPNTRKAALRMAITLGEGGVLIPYFNLLRYYLGGKQGNGRQLFSWVHINDTCRMIEFIACDRLMNGTYNCASPNPVTNAVFMQTLRKITQTPGGLPAPAWLLKAGAWLIGTETELVLKSRWVIPTRIQQAGFVFQYPSLEDALIDIIAKVPRRQYRLW